MIDAQKPDRLTLTNLLGRIREGRFVVPNFQRDFEWDPGDINALIRSIFLDYYIGSLLLWRGKPENIDMLACRPIKGFGADEPDSSAEHIVLDGQQRLTALYYACMAPDMPAPKRKNRYLFFVKADRLFDGDFDDAFVYDWTRSGTKLADDHNRQFATHTFPVLLIGTEDQFVLSNWLQAYLRYWEHEVTKCDVGTIEHSEASRALEYAHDFVSRVQAITTKYQVTYVELDRELTLVKVCEIFTQINSRGVRLDVFDLINAMLTPRGLELRYMWEDAAPRLEFVESNRMNVYVLQVMSLILQSYCSPNYLYYLIPGQERKIRAADGTLRKEILVPSPDEFRERWNKAIKSLERAIALLRHPQEFGAISSRYLPYVSIIPAFSALQSAARELTPETRLGAQRKIRRWYWASVFTNRYSGSVESTAARDFLDVQAWFRSEEAEPPVIAEFEMRFRTLDLMREIKRGTSIYNGIFNLLVLNGAPDWVSGNVPQNGELDDHHIIPRAWGQKSGRGDKINTILNRTPLSADTNRHVISDRLPNEYLPELIASNGETAVRKILESHFISPLAFDILMRSPFTADDFDEFVAERQRTLIEAIEELLVHARLDLSPHLRELDARIEAVELKLRKLVASALGMDVSLIPEHIRLKMAQRAQLAVKRSPSLTSEEAHALPKFLEYADLREIEQAIINKSLWGEKFADTFSSKEQLANRFGQLAELRNGIRHSRAVDEITRKDGEAALLWFGQILANQQ